MIEVTGIYLRRMIGELHMVLNLADERLGFLCTTEDCPKPYIVVPTGKWQNRLIQMTSNAAWRTARSRRGRWYDPAPEEIECLSSRQRNIYHVVYKAFWGTTQ